MHNGLIHYALSIVRTVYSSIILLDAIWLYSIPSLILCLFQVLRESIKIYVTITDGILSLVDKVSFGCTLGRVLSSSNLPKWKTRANDFSFVAVF